MNNKDIPADKINESVARALGRVVDLKDKSPLDSCFCKMPDGYIRNPAGGIFAPLTNHNQFHDLWTPEMEAKAVDVLDDWLTEINWGEMDPDFPLVVRWNHTTKYQSNRRLWQLRAVCEVVWNEG